jgi:hypothetical protein
MSSGLLAIASSPTAHAHAGEHSGNFFSLLMHLVTNPDHLPVIIVSVIVLVLGIRAWKKSG